MSREMPPFAVLAAALRKTTECLAREVAQPTHSPPRWNKLEWAIARASAAMQGVSMLLANGLRWSGPPIWQSFLTEQREHSLLRHARIGVLLEQVDATTREARIGCVGLKGAALRALGFYGPGDRPMGDIDLLVDARELASMDAALLKLDYVLASTARRHIVYEPRRKGPAQGFGEHVENPLKIEIHTAVAELLPIRKVDITSELQPTRSRPGIQAYPSLAMLMLHLVLHAGGNMRAHALRQIQLHDIAALARRLGDADWQTLLAQPPGEERRWWVFPALALTAAYYPESIPLDVLRETCAACPRTLRFAIDRKALTDVSWSNLRIHAFPGIAWSRTPLDAFRYMHSRVFPSRTALAELELTREAQPRLDQVRWYGISHRRRIARWLLSRPPRVQTMVSVTAALDGTRLNPD